MSIRRVNGGMRTCLCASVERCELLPGRHVHKVGPESFCLLLLGVSHLRACSGFSPSLCFAALIVSVQDDMSS